MRRILLALVAALLMTSLVGCGSKSSSSATTTDTTTATTAAIDTPATFTAPSDCPTKGTEMFGKTRALVDLGLIYGAGKHWIIDPYKKDKIHGVFAKGKAVAAAAAIYFLSKALLKHVNGSPILCKTLGAPVRAIAAATEKLKSINPLKIGSEIGGLTSLGGALGALPGLGTKDGGFDLKSLAKATAGL